MFNETFLQFRTSAIGEGETNEMHHMSQIEKIYWETFLTFEFDKTLFL